MNPPFEWEDLELDFTAIEQEFGNVEGTLAFLKGLQFYSGTGAPTVSAPGGSYYFNHATPGAAGARIYFNTATGVNWIGVL